MSWPRWKLANDLITSRLIASMPPFHVSRGGQVLHAAHVHARLVARREEERLGRLDVGDHLAVVGLEDLFDETALTDSRSDSK